MYGMIRWCLVVRLFVCLRQQFGLAVAFIGPLWETRNTIDDTLSYFTCIYVGRHIWALSIAMFVVDLDLQGQMHICINENVLLSQQSMHAPSTLIKKIYIHVCMIWWGISHVKERGNVTIMYKENKIWVLLRKTCCKLISRNISLLSKMQFLLLSICLTCTVVVRATIFLNM